MTSSDASMNFSDDTDVARLNVPVAAQRTCELLGVVVAVCFEIAYDRDGVSQEARSSIDHELLTLTVHLARLTALILFFSIATNLTRWSFIVDHFQLLLPVQLTQPCLLD